MRHDVGVAGLAGDAVLSLAAEHTVPGVDAILWWNGSQFLGSDAFAHLVTAVDAVILDSSGRERGEAVIREVAAFAERYPGVALHDLAFMRLDPWMDMIAQFFDDPALREDLFSIESLRVESGSEAEAHYLASWLGSRLSWKALDAHSFRAHDGRSIRLEREVAGDLRRVRRVVLTAGDSTYTAALSELDPNTVCLTVEGAKAKATRCAPLRNIDNVSLIERALLKSGNDQIFDTSLVTVRELLT
jgi:glucose-6-phosphate dehydrogenase assembly protein OpcA